MSQRIRVAVLLCGALCATAVAGVNSFTFTGPEGGFTFAVAVQPGHPEVVLASTGRGLYRSGNAGANWSLVMPERIGTIESMEFDPLTPDRVYAVAGKFWRSIDGGRTFPQSIDLPSRPNSLAVSGNRVYLSSINGEIRRSDDDAVTWNTLTVPWSVGTTPILYGIAADPANDNVLYACVQGQGVYKTVNHGDSWLPPAPGPCQGQYAYTWHIAVSPGDSNRLIAPTSEGLFLSTNGGVSWNLVIPSPLMLWVKFDPHAPNIVLGAGLGNGWILRSTDGGATWPSTGAHLNLQEVRDAAFGGAAGQLYLATETGPLFSADSGDTFAPRFTGIQASTVTEMKAADDGTIYAMQTWGQAGLWKRTPGSWAELDNAELRTKVGGILDPISFDAAADNSSLLYYADESRLYRSNNGGVDWTAPPASLNTQVFGIGVDPTNPQIAYAALAAGGMKRTVDGGLTYTPCGLDNSIFIRHLRVDRAAPDIVYGWGAYPPNNRVFKSTDHCQSWAPVSPTFQYPINDVVIHPVDHNRIFLVHLEGVQESRDGGATWQPLHFNLQYGDFVLGLRLLIDPLLPSTMWVINGDLAGFTRSVDDGATWQTVNFLSGGFGVSLDVGVLDPLHPDTLVAGTNSFGLVEYQVAPDLELSMGQLQADLPAGASVGPEVSVHNLGPHDASAADIDITLPAFLTMPNPPAACTGGGRNFHCHVGPIRVNQVVRIALPLSISSVGSGTIEATMTGHETDPVMANNSLTRNANSVRHSDLEMVAPATVSIGHGRSVNIDYNVANRGPANADATGANFSLSAGLEAASVSTSFGTCTIAAPRLVNCQFGFLATNISPAVRLRVTGVDTGAREILADVYGDVTDSNQNQHARTAVEVRKLADLSLEITPNNGNKTPGAPFDYTVIVRNNGPDAVNSQADFTVTGAAVTAASSPTAACVTTPSVRCTLTSLASGGTANIQLTLNAASAGSVAGDFSVAETDGDLDDPDTANNRGTFTTTVASPGGGGSGGGNGGGGGGRFDWLAAGLLALLLARQRFSRRAASSYCGVGSDCRDTPTESVLT